MYTICFWISSIYTKRLDHICIHASFRCIYVYSMRDLVDEKHSNRSTRACPAIDRLTQAF